MKGGWLAVWTMAALLLLWIAFTVQYAIILLLDGKPLTITLGIALLVFPIIGLWWLVLEARFVIGGERLLRRMRATGELPVDDLPRLASGRIDPKAGRDRFPAAQAEAEQEPDNWKSWVRLSLAYDAAGDRKRARWAMRRALRLKTGSLPS